MQAGAEVTTLERCLNGVRPRGPESGSGGAAPGPPDPVSMGSGHEGRNQDVDYHLIEVETCGLNGVRPRGPESGLGRSTTYGFGTTSQWGLATRAGISVAAMWRTHELTESQWGPATRAGISRGWGSLRLLLGSCLNGVRPRGPESDATWGSLFRHLGCLNGVRPRGPESARPRRAAWRSASLSQWGPATRAGISSVSVRVVYATSAGLNGVRPRGPESGARPTIGCTGQTAVSMGSGHEGRNQL